MSKQELTLELARIPIRVESEGVLSEDLGILTDYVGSDRVAVHHLKVSFSDVLPEPEGTEVYTGGDFRVYRAGETLCRIVGDLSRGADSAYLYTRHQGERTEALFRRSALDRKVGGKQILRALDVNRLITEHRGILLHASFIEYEGKAILFTAPSETGKSTQAQLWCDHAGAALVNGDRAAIRIIDGGVYACGIPMSGSSPVRRNVMLPLAAIVYLSQAPQNRIEKLRGVRAFRRVWEGCTVNLWERAEVDLATRTVTDILSRVPVYHLACTPDAGAVHLLKHTLEVEP